MGEGEVLPQLLNIQYSVFIIHYNEIWGYSSAGRAPALQAGGQRFDPAYLHHGCYHPKEPLGLGN